MANIVTAIAKEIAEQLARSLLERRRELDFHPQGPYVGVTALGWATATQAIFCGLTDEEAIAAFKRTLEQVRQGVEAGRGTLEFIAIDVTPEAKA